MSPALYHGHLVAIPTLRETSSGTPVASEVIIEGQLRRNDWESEGGQKHSKHFLKAESCQ
jgi:hypothetical protein